MSIINMTCGEINSSVGFVLVILSVILNQTLIDSDCEQSWYTEQKDSVADRPRRYRGFRNVSRIGVHLSAVMDSQRRWIADTPWLCSASAIKTIPPRRLTMETMFREKYHDSVCNNNEPEDLDQTIYKHVHQDHQQLPIEFGGNFHGLNYKREANVEIQVLLQKTEGLTMENEGKLIKRSSSMDMLINFSDEGPDEIDEISEMKNQIGLGNTHNTCSEARSIYFEQNRSEIKPWPVIFVIKLKIVI
ncbi:uncharacterized protein LOC125261616 [Megalobrama amblycephala]|uniref:uncharacterized protein LOC125261616 n=1 Tax=Megalobrama amblycephala TaxID=75352 RepID=UPI0020147DBA|nr:uncharacterized protein LOC125261616 [Megalobrama amblycephala]